PAPNRHQNRAAEADAQTAAERSEVPAVFRNEPDTDPSLPANQAWVRRIIAAATAPGYLDDRPNAPAVEPTADLDEMIARGGVAAAGWRELAAAGRAETRHRAADIYAARRGEYLTVAAGEVGKRPAQAPPEVSEASDV